MALRKKCTQTEAPTLEVWMRKGGDTELVWWCLKTASTKAVGKTGSNTVEESMLGTLGVHMRVRRWIFRVQDSDLICRILESWQIRWLWYLHLAKRRVLCRRMEEREEKRTRSVSLVKRYQVWRRFHGWQEARRWWLRFWKYVFYHLVLDLFLSA